MTLTRKIRWLARITIYPLLLIALSFGVQRLTGNFHDVEPGVLYRSAQLTETQLREAVASHGIRTIVNLRGSNPGKGWYDTELRVSRELGVAHIDIGLSSDREPDDALVDRLVATLRSAGKPALVHCAGGADRSGLAAALYSFAVTAAPSTEAARQLSIWYGHFPWLWSETGAMDRSFARFVTRSEGEIARADP